MNRLIVDTFWVSGEALWDSAPLKLLATRSNFSLISEPELVRKLAALQVAIERVKFHYRNDASFHGTVMTPFLIANANLARINASMLHWPGHPEIPATFPDAGFASSDVASELLSNVESQNLLVAKMERCTDKLDVGHPGIERHLTIVTEILRAELGQYLSAPGRVQAAA